MVEEFKEVILDVKTGQVTERQYTQEEIDAILTYRANKEQENSSS
jgi:hypothetical protein